MSTYSTSSIPQGIQIYANATLFPVTAQDGEQAVAADTNTLYIYDTSIPGWQAVANPGAAIAIDALTGEVTATGPGVVNATITNAAVTNAKLAAMPDNTVKGNISGAPASPSDLTGSQVTSILDVMGAATNLVGGTKGLVPSSLAGDQLKLLRAGADWATINTVLDAQITVNTSLGNNDFQVKGQADSNLIYADASTDRVGIGSNSPNAKLQVNNSGTQLGLSVYSTSTNNTAELYNQGTTNYTLALNSAANSNLTGASIGGYFARGTLSSRSQTLANDVLLSITASGHTGTAVAPSISGAIVIAAAENTTATNIGGQIGFATTPNATLGLPVTRMVIGPDGKVNITGLTASELVATDSLKNLQSLSTTTYPSLTEISYVKGVTSAIQTQLNSKVSSVGATAPVSSSGGTTPTISMTQAGAASDGWLSSTDWNTFNNKQPAGTYVTSVGATSPVASSGGTTPTISMTQSGAATDGYLSSTDWNTFNNAASSVAAATALSTPSTLMARDASGETALDGLSLDGSTSGSIKLQAAATTTSYTVKMPSAQGAASTFLQNDGSGNLSWNTVTVLPSQTSNADKVLATDGTSASWQFAGLGSGAFGTGNVILGRSKPSGLTTGTLNVIVGPSTTANSFTTAERMTIIGSEAGKVLSTGGQSTIIGERAGLAVTTSSFDVVIGERALSITTSSGGTNTVVGFRAGESITGSSNVCIGNNTATSLTSATGTVSVGPQANASGNSSIAIGNLPIASGTNSIVIGYNAISRANYCINIGDNAAAGFGSGAPNNIIIGNSSGRQIQTGTTGTYNVTLGSNACSNLSSGSNNLFLGNYSGKHSTTQSNEFFVDNQDRTTYVNQQSKSLLYGTFNATETSQTLRINAQTQLAYGEKHASLHGQTGTLDVITALTSNYYIGVDCSLAAKTVNLPAAATAGQGFVLVIKDESGSAATNNITIDASGAELIDGAATQTINANYGSLSLICSGTAWFLAP